MLNIFTYHFRLKRDIKICFVFNLILSNCIGKIIPFFHQSRSGTILPTPCQTVLFYSFFCLYFVPFVRPHSDLSHILLNKTPLCFVSRVVVTSTNVWELQICQTPSSCFPLHWFTSWDMLSMIKRRLLFSFINITWCCARFFWISRIKKFICKMF